MNKLRILHVATEKTWRGGERQLLLLARGVVQRGHGCWIAASASSEIARRASLAGLNVIQVPTDRTPGAVLAVRRAAKALRADILHSHDGHAVTICAFVRRLGSRARHVVTRRVDFPISGRIKYDLGADRVIAISAAIRNVLIAGGVREEKIRLVYSGIDPLPFETKFPAAQVNRTRREVFAKAKASGTPQDAPPRELVLNVAGLTDHKGQRYLIDAWPLVIARRPGAVLAVAGEGELRDVLLKQSRERGVAGRVVFLGFRRDVPLLMAAADLFVMSSHLEGLCTSVMDAMASRLAAVVTDAGGLPEVAADGETGLVVLAKNPPALAEAVVRLLSDSPLRRRMGSAGRCRVLEHFTADSMVDGNLAVYTELAGAK